MCQSERIDASQHGRDLTTDRNNNNTTTTNWQMLKGESSSLLGGGGDDDVVMTSMAMVQSRRNQMDEDKQKNGQQQRTKRDIFHLYNMMSCTTQCDPLSYKGYGCYCGFLGSGLTVDAIDR
jgi:hypothetical protein